MATRPACAGSPICCSAGMASDSLQHAKDQVVLDYVEQAVLREGEAIRSKCIAKTSKPIRVFGLKEKYANVRNWLQADIPRARDNVRSWG